jgi:hypothetical protein
VSHYYTKNAAGVVEPRHFVPMTSRPGELRPSRITDARKGGWHVSVTTIQNLLDRPALTDWKIQEHLKTVFELGSLEGFSMLDEFIKIIKQKTQEALDKAPQEGTDFHDVMEQYIKGSLSLEHPQFHAARETGECLRVNTGVDPHVWNAEIPFITDMGFGGKVDAHYELRNTEQCWVVDWKTKNDAVKWKPGKMAYKEMAQQLAAYRVGLGLPKARCANIFVCIPTGQTEFHEWEQETLDTEWANFADLLRIWLRNAEYTPGTKSES